MNMFPAATANKATWRGVSKTILEPIPAIIRRSAYLSSKESKSPPNLFAVPKSLAISPSTPSIMEESWISMAAAMRRPLTIKIEDSNAKRKDSIEIRFGLTYMPLKKRNTEILVEIGLFMCLETGPSPGLMRLLLSSAGSSFLASSSSSGVSTSIQRRPVTSTYETSPYLIARLRASAIVAFSPNSCIVSSAISIALVVQ